MSGNKQVLCMYFLIVMLSIFQSTKGNKDLALAPMSEERFLPNPITCVKVARKIPKCIEAVKNFQYKSITKECCIILLDVPENCFGIFFPIRFNYRVMLKVTCKLMGIGN